MGGVVQGCATKMGLVFCKKSLNMGPFYQEKFLTLGLIFKIFQGSLILNFLCVLVAKLHEMGTHFQENPYIWAVPIFGTITPDCGYGS